MDMTASAETTSFEQLADIVIEASAQAVLDYVSNPQSWQEWMPATHEIQSDDRPLLTGETFTERWATRKGEVGLQWRVTKRTDPTLWQAETEAPFTGPIVARYELDELGPHRCRYVRRIINPARPKPPTPEMIERMNTEADVCLANIKRLVEIGVSSNPPQLRSRYVDPEELSWSPSDFPGIETKVLWSEPETGRSTILFKLAPGAVVPSHTHTDVEQTWVLSGTFEDDEGQAAAGHYIWRPAGNRHEARSPTGAVILSVFGKPNVFDDGSGFYTELQEGER